MRTRGLLGISGAIAALALLAAQPAAAATEVGNSCEGNSSAENFTLISAANETGNPLPAVIPSAGVITRWTFKVAPIPSGLVTQDLKILRPTSTPNQFQVVGESGQTPVSGGLNTFSTRISVKAGDRIALTGAIPSEGKTLTIFCNTPNTGDRVGIIAGSPANGTTATSIGEEPKIQLPVKAVIEPDVDGDGYGDETQDQCPQSAAVQVACPVVVLDAYPLAQKGAVRVLVATSTGAPVSVSGVVKTASGKVTLKAPATEVTPGKIAKITLKFPGKLKTALRKLRSSKKLTLKITAKATNVAGLISTDSSVVKLPGQAS